MMSIQSNRHLFKFILTDQFVSITRQGCDQQMKFLSRTLPKLSHNSLNKYNYQLVTSRFTKIFYEIEIKYQTWGLIDHKTWINQKQCKFLQIHKDHRSIIKKASTLSFIDEMFCLILIFGLNDLVSIFSYLLRNYFCFQLLDLQVNIFVVMLWLGY